MKYSDTACARAIDLFKNPRLLNRYRKNPVAPDVSDLLTALSNDDLLFQYMSSYDIESIEVMREIIEFYVMQILLYPQSDPYRTLGLNSLASKRKVRAHMVLLMRWLHPDLNIDEIRVHYCTRVISAWNLIKKTPSHVHDNFNLASDEK